MGHMRSTATRFGCFHIIYSASDSTFASFKRALHNTNTTIPSPSALSFSQLVHNLKSNEPPSSRPFGDIRLLNCLLFSINSSKNLGNCPPVVAWFKRILDSVDSQSILFNYLLPLQALMASWSVIPGSAVDGSRAVVMKADASSFVSHLELDISSSTSSPSSFSTSPFVSALESAISRFQVKVVPVPTRESAMSSIATGSTLSVVGQCFLVAPTLLIVSVKSQRKFILAQSFTLRTSKTLLCEPVSWDSDCSGSSSLHLEHILEK